MATGKVSARALGRLPDGQVVDEYTLDNGAGLRLRAINLGGIVTAIECPDREGRVANVVLGFDGLEDYLLPHPNFGALVGRYANRIAGAGFTLDGRACRLAANDGTNTLHGGANGYGSRWWAIEPLPPGADGSVAIELKLCSADGDQGFPGRLDITVRYTLSGDNAWRIDYEAQTTHVTVVNLTHHGYYNLAGGGTALDHRLVLHAEQYLEVDARLIPTQLASVSGTPFDFRQPRIIGERIRQAHAQLMFGRGYDHCYVLDGAHEPGLLREAARLEDPLSGRVMTVQTTEPGIQFYSGNFLDGRLLGAGGQACRQGDGVCLETQHFPDSPNRADFPSTVLRPGQTYRSTTVHRFGTAG